MQRLFFLILITLAAVSAHSQDAATGFDRSAATAIIADMRKIVVPGGIERLEKVRIGGIDQWVSIRGNDPRNPVLLMLHGGPGWVGSSRDTCKTAPQNPKTFGLPVSYRIKSADAKWGIGFS